MKHFISLLILILLPVFTVGGVNYIADPLQIYRQQSGKNLTFWNNQRYQNAGKIRSHLSQDGYDSVIIGNSVTDCFIPNSLEKYLGWEKTLKLTIKGGTISEQSFTLKEALKTNKIKHVFWGLRVGNFIHDKEDVWHIRQKIPFYLYTPAIWDDGPYFFNNAMFKNSTMILQGRQPSKQWLNSKNAIDEINYWMTPERVKAYLSYESSEKYKKTLKKASRVKTLKIRYDNKYIFPSMDKHIVQNIKANPNVEFILFIAPQHYLVIKSRGKKNEKYMAAQKQLIKEFVGLSNVSIYGFEDVKLIVGNLSNYRDNLHYHSGVNLWMLRRIAVKKQRLTLDNIDTYLSTVTTAAKNYKPVFDYGNVIPMRSIMEQDVYNEERKRLKLPI